MFKHLLLSLSLITAGASAENIHYEIYQMKDKGPPTLVASGNRTYSAKDFKLQKVREHVWNKLLELEPGFEIGITDLQNPKGFSLTAHNSPDGSGAEWFELTAPDRYTKLEEMGNLQVSHRKNGSVQEISQVTFDTDVSLRINQRSNQKTRYHDSHYSESTRHLPGHH